MEKALSKIGIKTKIGFGIGDLGFNIGVQATALVLIKFYTDTLLIGAGIAGIVVLVAKIVDAVTDPAMGFIADRTHTRWGKYRPYILFGAIPFGLSFFLLLNAPVTWSEGARVGYAFVTYIFFCLMLTVTNVPYQSLLPVLTKRADERVALSSFRSVLGILGVLIAAVAIESCVSAIGGDNSAHGYRVAAGIFGGVMAITTLLCFFWTRENYVAKTYVKLSIGESIKLLVGNKPFLILCAGVLLTMTAVNILAATIFYYFEYYLMDAGAGPIGFGIAFFAAIVTMPLFVKISKTRSNRDSYILGIIVMIIGLLGMFIVGRLNLILSFAFMLVFGIGLSTHYLCPWPMVANTVEYSQMKTGVRKESTFYGLFFFMVKLSAALAGFIVGQVLEAGKYVANLVNQADTALMSIRMLTTIIPIVVLAIGAVVLSFFKITGKMHEEMVRDIDAKGMMS